jgi:hypothetical protein
MGLFLRCTVVLLLSGTLAAQSVSLCGTDGQVVKDQMIANRMELPGDIAFVRNDITYVPVRLHAVSNNNGSGEKLAGDLIEMMCLLNEGYLDQNIQFYLKRMDYNTIQNSSLNNNPESNFTTIRRERILDAINVFAVDNIRDVESSVIAGVYWGPERENDFIIIHHDFLTDVRVLVHEVGHFFSLPHPFHGWDRDPWDPDKHGNPVGALAPDGRTLNEYADRSNCDSTLSQNQNNVGDGICDTPADYNLVSGAGCRYTLNALDPQGNAVSPAINNFMNYFNRCAQYQFTPGQKKEILRSLNSSTRTYLDVENFAALQEVTGRVQLESPANGETVNNSNGVEVHWNSVEGATHYLVEIDFLPSFTSVFEAHIVEDTTFIFEGLENGRNYFWRIKGLNKYSFCAPESTPWRFKAEATTSTSELTAYKGWKVYPNPLQRNTELTMMFESDETFTADLRYYSANGQQLFEMENIQVLDGHQAIDVPYRFSNPGLYLVRLTTDDGYITRKVIVH